MCFAVAVPFLSHFVFALKNVVFVFGMNPVVWLRLKLRDIIKLRKDMGVSTDLLPSLLVSDLSLRNLLIQCFALRQEKIKM